jgi:4-hydroxy-tetrahydrodipicolinate reductase
MKMKIAIIGAAGRMGKMLCSLAQTYGCEVVSKVDIAPGFDQMWSDETEGVIDFSFHGAIPELVAKAAASRIPYVIGTTGLSDDEQDKVDKAAKSIPIVQSGNYSLGVNLLLELVNKAAKTLGGDYDVEITEFHHKHKKDAPSGTALMLAKSAAEGRGCKDEFLYGRQGETGERSSDEIAIHAIRGGSVVGEHNVIFAGDVERIELVHKAEGRQAFAAGALKALVWAKSQQPGLYTMRDVLGFN